MFFERTSQQPFQYLGTAVSWECSVAGYLGRGHGRHGDARRRTMSMAWVPMPA